jgi:hypothetical protein
VVEEYEFNIYNYINNNNVDLEVKHYVIKHK